MLDTNNLDKVICPIDSCRKAINETILEELLDLD